MFYYYEFIIFLLLLVFCPLELLIIVDVIQCTGLNVGEHAVTPFRVGVFRQMLARLKLKKRTKMLKAGSKYLLINSIKVLLFCQ